MGNNLAIFYGTGPLSQQIRSSVERLCYDSYEFMIDTSPNHIGDALGGALNHFNPDSVRIHPFAFGTIREHIQSRDISLAYFVGDFPRALTLYAFTSRRAGQEGVAGADDLFKEYYNKTCEVWGPALRYFASVNALLVDLKVRTLLARELSEELCLAPGTSSQAPVPQRVVESWIPRLIPQLTSTQETRKRISQALVIDRGMVLHRDSGRGTDHLIETYGAQPATNPQHPTLLKLPTCGFPIALDQPTIGPNTVEKCSSHGIAGIVVSSDFTVVAQREETIKLCDAHGLFLYAYSQADLRAS